MREENGNIPHSHPIHCKNQPLYFANFPHHPIYRVYRHRQNLTPKIPNLENRHSAKQKVAGRVAKESKDKGEETGQSRKQKKAHANHLSISHTVLIYTPKPQIQPNSPLIMCYSTIHHPTTRNRGDTIVCILINGIIPNLELIPNITHTMRHEINHHTHHKR